MYILNKSGVSKVSGRKVCHISSDGRRYQEFLEWLAEGNVPEYDKDAVAINRETQEKKNAEARQYLKETDWYIIREYERGNKPCPQDIRNERMAKADSVVDPIPEDNTESTEYLAYKAEMDQLLEEIRNGN